MSLTKLYRPVLLLLAVLGPYGLLAQSHVQTVRGQVLDKESKMPLIGANVLIRDLETMIGTTTDIDGYFKIEKVPVGRRTIEVSYIGYEPAMMNSIMLTTGKELVLNIELLESTVSMETIVVKANHDKAETLNEMASVSARSFSVEETGRYAAAFNDPARMALNFAGVTGGGDDLSNEIVVRGNSPRGVLWRLEGIEIPNPNHFSAMGSSGGAISMLSSSTLATSDFYTGAFPAEYGNATSGVFDLNLRNGNNEQREYAFMLGALGIEAAAEGPFVKGKRASYLLNFRYSTLSALKAVGLNPVGDILPDYQDLSFKVNVPTKKAGTFSLFGLGGTNRAFFEPEKDTTTWNDNDWGNEGFLERQRVGTIGLSHRMLLSDRSYLKTVVAASTEQYREEYYYLDAENDFNKRIDETGDFSSTTYRISTTYNHKFNARHTLRAGAIASYQSFNLEMQSFDYDLNQFQVYFDNEGETELYQTFAQWKYRFRENWTFLSGLHATYFNLDGQYSIEPRTALKWQLHPAHSLSLAAGLHSKPEHISFYFVEQSLEGEERRQPNKDIDLMKSAHFVLGYDWRINPNLRVKAEAYYQHLYDVPVEIGPESTNSIINAADIWDILGADEAVNEGTGRNYGLDLTVERFFADQYYFLITGTLFESKYTPQNGVEYGTRYNTNYQLNLLGGKEWNVGKKNNHILGVNTKFLLAGGNRFTPIDFERSAEAGYTVIMEDRRFEDRTKPYYRLDIGVNYKINSKRMTHTIALDIQNVTNRLNVYTLYYSSNSGQLEEFTQTGFFPNFNYRVEF
jgi:hypothetical protein